MRDICTCRTCRETIRAAILATFAEQRRWMGRYTIMFLARLGWVPSLFYRSVLAEMVSWGILLVSYDPASDDFPRYLPARLCRVRAMVRKGGGA
jgi:hypothetical protein